MPRKTRCPIGGGVRRYHTVNHEPEYNLVNVKVYHSIQQLLQRMNKPKSDIVGKDGKKDSE